MNTFTIKDLIKFIKWDIVTLMIIFGLLSAINVVQIDFFSKMIASTTESTMDNAKKFLIMSFSFFMFGTIMYFINNLIIQFISKKLKYRLIKQLLNYSTRLKSSTIESTTSGVILWNIIFNPNSVLLALTEILSNIGQIIISLVLTIYMFILNYIFGLVMLVFFIINITYVFITIKKSIKMGMILRQTSKAYTSQNIEIINSHNDIKSLHTASSIHNNMDSIISNYDKSRTQNDLYRFKTNFGSDVMMRIFAGLIPIILGIVCQQYAFSIVSAIFILNNAQYAENLGTQMNYIYRLSCDIKIYADDIKKFTSTDSYPIESFGNVNILALKGDIEFKNVAFSYKYKYYNDAINYDFDKLYNESMSKKQTYYDIIKNDEDSSNITKQVFSNLNFKIKAGQKVAFVGQSGSGKSTILNLIAKFDECQSGQVLLDGININDLTQDTIRNNICMVSQNTYIFNGTIRYNLQLVKPNASEEELWSACKKAYFDEFVSGLDKGLDTNIGENGIKLSGGQKQRLAIARAFLRDSQIVIFDESTSALDNEAQAHIQKSIDNFVGRTVIIVAHRLSTIINVDKIYYLQEGVITNSGTFDELMKQDKSFKELFLAENI